MAQLKQIQDLPGLCTAVLSSFWDKWDNSRQAEFYTYCQTVLSYINVSPSVVYTRYADESAQLYISSKNQMDEPMAKDANNI